MSVGKYKTNVEPYLDLIKSMRIDGHTEEQIHKYLDIGHSAWNNYKIAHVELVEALKMSKIGLVSKLEQTLFQKALAGNPTLLIFALKNLAPKKWADRKVIDPSGFSEFFSSMKDFENNVGK
jgi:hypothetical protein